jgi:hypothetical protein
VKLIIHVEFHVDADEDPDFERPIEACERSW